jgi:hypothetical protein
MFQKRSMPVFLLAESRYQHPQVSAIQSNRIATEMSHEFLAAIGEDGADLRMKTKVVPASG